MCSSPDTIRITKDDKMSTKFYSGTQKRPFRWCDCRLEDNIKTDVKDIMCRTYVPIMVGYFLFVTVSRLTLGLTQNPI